MTRILVLCSRLPYPLTGGAKLRMFYTARELAREHDVELLVIDQEPIDKSAVEALRAEFDAIHVFAYPNYKFYLNTLPGLASSKPLQTHYYRFDEVDAWLDDHAHRFDLLHCNHVRTTEYARGRSPPVTADLVDAISRTYREASKDATGLWRAIYPVEWRRLRKYERSVADCFDHSFIITEADRNFVTGRQSFPSLSVLPNGVKPDLVGRGSNEFRTAPNDPRIVFLGKMDYFPNEDAALYFIEEVFPIIRSRYPTAEFQVVGTDPSDRVASTDARPGVTVTGFVDDPAEYLDRADIVVAPMRHGSGLQNKVLEAMALGRPVVATPLAREGINALDGKHIVISDTATEFANAIDQLLSDADKRRAIGTAARTLVEQRYTWAQIGSELRDRVSTLLDRHADAE
nr:glycosyltransferase [Haloarcula sp. CBA1127]